MLYRLQAKYAAYLFVLPFLVIFSVFGLYPMIRSLILAMYISSGPSSQVFVGLDNFKYLLSDPDFWLAVKNTAIFAFFSVFLQLPISLGLALLVNRSDLKGRNFWRFAFFSPHLMGLVFAAVLFTLILAPRFGLLNVTLDMIVPGFDLETRWLGNSNLVMPALILTSLWLYVGFNMIYFLAALQSVDKSLYEAARVDGANRWQQFLHVTIPGIKPVMIFVIVLSTIGSFQLFELPFLLLGNGPGPDQAGLTVVMYLYQNGFEIGDLGYASAIGWMLVVGVLAIAVVQIFLSGTLKKEQ